MTPSPASPVEFSSDKQPDGSNENGADECSSFAPLVISVLSCGASNIVNEWIHEVGMSADVAVISLNQLRVHYGAFTAVDNLSLDICRGELFGLLGPNGAGKSTTIRVLIGQRQPNAGSVTIAGFDIVRDWAKIKPVFGYVPDRENHFEEFTGRRNLEFFADLYGVPRMRVRDCLKLVELDEAGDLPVRGYSLGMRRKLLLARALIHEPKILYLDEPTANLDIHSAEVVHRILRDRVADGATVILTTHDMDEVEKICDRVGIMCKGKLIALDSPMNLKQAHTERKVDVITTIGERLVFNLDEDADRQTLAEVIRAGRTASLKTREFDFHATFLKLTGLAFD